MKSDKPTEQSTTDSMESPKARKVKQMPWMPYERAQAPSGGWGQVMARQLAGEMMAKRRAAMAPTPEMAAAPAPILQEVYGVQASTPPAVAPGALVAVPQLSPAAAVSLPPMDSDLRQQIMGLRAPDRFKRFVGE